MTASEPSRPRRVVIPIIAGLGNSLMAMPMIRQIKHAWPDAKITLLVRNNSFGELFKRMPEVDEILPAGLTFKNTPHLLERLRSRFSDLLGFGRMIRWTRQRRPDVYLVPFPSNRWEYSILALTSGAKKRILNSYPVGYWRALHFIGTRTPAEPKIHDVVQNLRLLKLMGIEPVETEAPRYLLTKEDRQQADELLLKTGLLTQREGDGGGMPSSIANQNSQIKNFPPPEYRGRGQKPGFIVIHAGSGSYTVIARAKRWNPQKYAELIDHIMRELGRSILLLEGPDESGVADSILKHLPQQNTGNAFPESTTLHVLKLSGPLAQTAAILERAELYVGSDSGLAHLAASVGRRAVTIFAPADPDRVCPYGSRDLVVQTENTCSPCFTYPFKTPYTDSKCQEPYCIEQVTVDRVLASVRRGLSSDIPLTVRSAS